MGLGSGPAIAQHSTCRQMGAQERKVIYVARIRNMMSNMQHHATVIVSCHTHTGTEHHSPKLCNLHLFFPAHTHSLSKVSRCLQAKGDARTHGIRPCDHEFLFTLRCQTPNPVPQKCNHTHTQPNFFTTSNTSHIYRLITEQCLRHERLRIVVAP